MPYGDRWRLHRRFFHQTFRVEALQRFLPFQHRKACHFLRQLLRSPVQFDEHIFECVFKVEYGDEHEVTWHLDTLPPLF